jgi:NADH:ubiquinone oxidoreductase subunit
VLAVDHAREFAAPPDRHLADAISPRNGVAAQIDELPGEGLPPVRKWQRDPEPNLTGTRAAFRPDGALGSGKIRPASTGDYLPWTPE